MSKVVGCNGCYNSLTNRPDKKSKLCTYCTRNPSLPSKRRSYTAKIDGILVAIPKDFYITCDRMNLEKKKREQELMNVLWYLKEKEKKRDPSPFSFPPSKIWFEEMKKRKHWM